MFVKNLDMLLIVLKLLCLVFLWVFLVLLLEFDLVKGVGVVFVCDVGDKLKYGKLIISLCILNMLDFFLLVWSFLLDLILFYVGCVGEVVLWIKDWIEECRWIKLMWVSYWIFWFFFLIFCSFFFYMFFCLF